MHSKATMRTHPPQELQQNFLLLEIRLEFTDMPPIGWRRQTEDVATRYGWVRDYDHELAFTRSGGRVADAKELVQALKAELPWINEAMVDAWCWNVASLTKIELTEGEKAWSTNSLEI